MQCKCCTYKVFFILAILCIKRDIFPAPHKHNKCSTAVFSVFYIYIYIVSMFLFHRFNILLIHDSVGCSSWLNSVKVFFCFYTENFSVRICLISEFPLSTPLHHHINTSDPCLTKMSQLLVYY